MIPLRKSPEPTIPFQTTAEEAMNLARIMVAMQAAGMDSGFIVAAQRLASFDQGVYDLMAMWEAESDAGERDEIVADIQDLIDDYQEAPSEPVEKPYIAFKDLDDVASKVLAHKKRLRELIDRHGGVTRVAEASGIPQPSLSRMLNSASMPRRSTLYRIANALKVPEQEIVTDWVR